MTDEQLKMLKLSAEGLCCSQIVIKMGLDEIGGESPELVSAAAGLCGGLDSGLVCGALSGGCCLLSLLGLGEKRRELVEWFRARYGGTDCSLLLESGGDAESTLCPKLVEEIYFRVMELSEDADGVF